MAGCSSAVGLHLGCTHDRYQERRLYDLGTAIRRKMGLTRLAEWGERMKPRLLPPARLGLLIMALISFASAVI